jgi:hypothetical protein
MLQPEIPLDEYFAGFPEARRVFDALSIAILAPGGVKVRATRSQVAFRRRRAFAWAWVPAIYLKGRDTAPLVLTLALRRRDPSPRWKEIVEPAPGRFTHHLELRSAAEIDEQVAGWLFEAWDTAR